MEIEGSTRGPRGPKNFTKCFPALKVTLINVKVISAPSPQETISSPAKSKKKRLLMMIKFPLKLLIWKPFKVNLVASI